MGLQSQLNDVSSDSIPLLLIALIGNCIHQLRSLLLNFTQSIGLQTGSNPDLNDGFFGSGLSGITILADQLNVNSGFAYGYCSGGERSDCVVCLTTLRDGDQVRKLDCRHVFHKDCLDGWVQHLNFNCPLCRSPLVTDEHVAVTGRRVGEDLLEWFALR